MKLLILASLFFSGISPFQATETFGIAYYQVPGGWQKVQNSTQVILEGRLKNGSSCRIIISASEEAVVSNEESYLVWRRQKISGDYSPSDFSPVVRKENSYNTALYSEATVSDKNKLKSSFYVFSNGQESFSVQFLSGDPNCDAVFRMFLDTLEIAEAVTDKAAQTNTKTKAYRSSKPRGRPRKNPA